MYFSRIFCLSIMLSEYQKQLKTGQSFVKGWGSRYQRTHIDSCECWFEIQMLQCLSWLDHVLGKMAPPGFCRKNLLVFVGFRFSIKIQKKFRLGPITPLAREHFRRCQQLSKKALKRVLQTLPPNRLNDRCLFYLVRIGNFASFGLCSFQNTKCVTFHFLLAWNTLSIQRSSNFRMTLIQNLVALKTVLLLTLQIA